MATPNKVQLALQHKLKNTVKMHQRNIRELKTPQPVGADIVQVQGLPNSNTTNLYGAYPLPPGSAQILNVTWRPAKQTLTLWQALTSVWIDPPSFASGDFPDPDYLFPEVAAIIPDASNVETFEHWDYYTSNDDENARTYKMLVVNFGTDTHTIWIAQKVYLPNLNQEML